MPSLVSRQNTTHQSVRRGRESLNIFWHLAKSRVLRLTLYTLSVTLGTSLEQVKSSSVRQSKVNGCQMAGEESQLSRNLSLKFSEVRWEVPTFVVAKGAIIQWNCSIRCRLRFDWIIAIIATTNLGTCLRTSQHWRGKLCKINCKTFDWLEIP